jgi:hypothetical protein
MTKQKHITKMPTTSFQDQEYYKDFYFIYTITGFNYLRPIIKSFPMIPNGTNVVILTNIPNSLKDIKVDNFNLIVDDLEKYRNDWSKIHEPLINIEDEQAYMDEYKRQFYDESYRYPSAVMRFGMEWAIQNNITKFILVDVGCKIGFDPGAMEYGFNTLYSFAKTRNIIFGNTWLTDERDLFKIQIENNTPISKILTEYIPEKNFDLDTYPKEVEIFTHFREHYRKIGSVGFDGYCFGLWFHDINLVKLVLNFWNDLVKIHYDTQSINIKNEHAVVVEFEYAFTYISDLLTKYHNTLIMPHYGIIHHFYHPENDFINVGKMPHLNLEPANTRKEFIQINREKLINLHSHEIATLIIDGIND